MKCYFMCICLFGIFCPTRQFKTQLETSTLAVKGYTFDLCSAMMINEH